MKIVNDTIRIESDATYIYIKNSTTVLLQINKSSGVINNIDTGTITIQAGGKIVMDGGGGSFIQVPALTSLERDALTPVDGYLLYNTTANKFQGYENGVWTNLI